MVLSIRMVLGKQQDSCLTPYTKINSKWIKDLNVRPATTKLLGVNKGKTSLTKVLTIIFLDMTPKTEATKMKINKWDHVELKSFNLKRNHQQIFKKQHKEWEKIFPKHISDKGLISKLYKAFTKLNSNPPKTQTIGLKNEWRTPTDVSSEKTYERTTSTRRGAYCHKSSRKQKSTITVRYHLKSVRTAIIKKTTGNKRRPGCGQTVTLVHCWWKRELPQSLWETLWSFFKKVKT